MVRIRSGAFAANPKLADFKCCISNVVMQEPVKAEDGFLYEKDRILAYFLDHRCNRTRLVSPITQEPMGESIIPASEVKAAISEFGVPVQGDRSVEWEEHGLQRKRRRACVPAQSSDNSKFQDMSEMMSEPFEELDSLRTLLQSVLQDLTPPRIIVFGDESSGKSSLLEHLAMMPIFPRSESFCTRSAIHVRLRRDPSQAVATLSVRHWEGREEVVESEEQVSIAQGHVQVRNAMLKLLDQEPSGSVPGVAKSKFIALEVRKADVPNIDLIDLPGLTNDVTRAPEVEKITEMYMEGDEQDPSNMYLVVVPACSRPNANGAVTYLKKRKLEPRTFGVFSQCDEAGKHKPDVLKSLVLGVPTNKGSSAGSVGHVPLERGWFCTMLAPLDEDVYYERHSYERLYTQKNNEITFFSGEQADPNLRDLFDQRKAGVSALVGSLTAEYHRHLHSTWMPSAMKKVLRALEEKSFECNMLGLKTVHIDQLMEIASAEVRRRLGPVATATLRSRFVNDKVCHQLYQEVLQSLGHARETSWESACFEEHLDHLTSPVLLIFDTFLEESVGTWVDDIRQLLSAKTRVKELSHESKNEKKLSVETVAAGVVLEFLPAQTKRETYRSIKEKPPFQLSQYTQYTDALVTVCRELFREAATDIKNEVQRLCQLLGNFESKWMNARLDFTDSTRVTISCDVEGFAMTLVTLCVRKWPSLDSLARLLNDVPVGCEDSWAIERRRTLDAEIKNIEAARDGIRNALAKSGCNIPEGYFESLVPESHDVEADENHVLEKNVKRGVNEVTVQEVNPDNEKAVEEATENANKKAKKAANVESKKAANEESKQAVNEESNEVANGVANKEANEVANEGSNKEANTISNEDDGKEENGQTVCNGE